MPRYRMTLARTIREYSAIELHAESDDAAKEAAKAIDIDDFLSNVTHTDDSGMADEIVMIDILDANGTYVDTLDDEICRAPDGEPYSWEAAELVKQIGAIQLTHEVDSHARLEELITKARIMCRLEKEKADASTP